MYNKVNSDFLFFRMGSQISGPAHPVPRRGNQPMQQLGSHKPFNIVPGTVDSGNTQRTCTNSSHHQHQHTNQQPQQPGYVVQSVTTTMPPGTVHRNTIIQPGPVTVMHTVPAVPSAPTEFTDSYGKPCDASGQPIPGAYGQPMNVSQPYGAPPPYPGPPMPAAPEYPPVYQQ